MLIYKNQDLLQNYISRLNDYQDKNTAFQLTSMHLSFCKSTDI